MTDVDDALGIANFLAMFLGLRIYISGRFNARLPINWSHWDGPIPPESSKPEAVVASTCYDIQSNVRTIWKRRQISPAGA